MEKKRKFVGFWVSIVLIVLFMFVVSACETDPGKDDPELPAALKNTNWIHKTTLVADGDDRIQFMECIFYNINI